MKQTRFKSFQHLMNLMQLAWREQHPITCDDSQQNSELRHKAVGPLDGDCWTDCFSQWAPGRTADRTNQVPCGMWSTCGALGYEGSKDQIISNHLRSLSLGKHCSCIWDVGIAVHELDCTGGNNAVTLEALKPTRAHRAHRAHNTDTITLSSDRFDPEEPTFCSEHVNDRNTSGQGQCFNVDEILRTTKNNIELLKEHAKCSDLVMHGHPIAGSLALGQANSLASMRKNVRNWQLHLRLFRARAAFNLQWVFSGHLQL